jgi:hypothetical protein
MQSELTRELIAAQALPVRDELSAAVGALLPVLYAATAAAAVWLATLRRDVA